MKNEKTVEKAVTTEQAATLRPEPITLRQLLGQFEQSVAVAKKEAEEAAAEMAEGLKMDPAYVLRWQAEVVLKAHQRWTGRQRFWLFVKDSYDFKSLLETARRVVQTLREEFIRQYRSPQSSGLFGNQVDAVLLEAKAEMLEEFGWYGRQIEKIEEAIAVNVRAGYVEPPAIERILRKFTTDELFDFVKAMEVQMSFYDYARSREVAKLIVGYVEPLIDRMTAEQQAQTEVAK